MHFALSEVIQMAKHKKYCIQVTTRIFTLATTRCDLHASEQNPVRTKFRP